MCGGVGLNGSLGLGRSEYTLIMVCGIEGWSWERNLFELFGCVMWDKVAREYILDQLPAF